MTTSAEISEDAAPSESADEVFYAVDEQAYEEAGEDYLFKVWQRLCWSGECRLCRRYPEGQTDRTWKLHGDEYLQRFPDLSQQGAVHHSQHVAA